MASRPHILVVNGRKVRQPVFVIGSPHSGADLVGAALKLSAGFHVTMGQPSVLSVVYAFARSPSIQRGRGDAAATVLRDAFAQAWQITPHACLPCSPACRQAGGASGARACVSEREVVRYGDASPDLMYCAETLVDAFPDARLVQVIRDGRDAVAAMLADAQTLGWFRPGVANVQAEFPNPFFGIETESDLAAWPDLSLAGKCAMRWRGSVHAMARLRTGLPPEQLTTLRYEQVLRDPAGAARTVSDFVGAEVAGIGPTAARCGAGQGRAAAGFGGRAEQARPPVAAAGAWRRALTARQLAEVEQVAGTDLRRVGYGGLGALCGPARRLRRQAPRPARHHSRPRTRPVTCLPGKGRPGADGCGPGDDSIINRDIEVDGQCLGWRHRGRRVACGLVRDADVNSGQ